MKAQQLFAVGTRRHAEWASHSGRWCCTQAPGQEARGPPRLDRSLPSLPHLDAQNEYICDHLGPAGTSPSAATAYLQPTAQRVHKQCRTGIAPVDDCATPLPSDRREVGTCGRVPRAVRKREVCKSAEGVPCSARSCPVCSLACSPTRPGSTKAAPGQGPECVAKAGSQSVPPVDTIPPVPLAHRNRRAYSPSLLRCHRSAQPGAWSPAPELPR